MSIYEANEAIAAPWEGLYIARCLRIVAEGGANLPDGGVKSLIEINERLFAPDLAPDLLPSEYLVRVGCKQSEHFAGLRREVDQSFSFEELKGLEVELERPELQDKRIANRGGH